MLKKIFLKSCVSVLALGVVIVATPACAGFEWVPPSSGAAAYQPSVSGSPVAPLSLAPSVVVSPAPPVATTMPEVISPVIISGVPKPTSMPLEPVPTAHAKIDFATATIGVPASTGAEIVQGFASQVPLVLALRQVLPAGYVFSLDQDVDMDVLVSYKGGKSWHETLGDMLQPVGLVSHEQGMTVTVSRAPASAVAMPPRAMKQSVEAPSLAMTPVLAPVSHNEVLASSNGGGWSVQRGETLRKVLTEWCQQAGIELQWLAEYDYPVEASAHFNGEFEEALRGLLAGFEAARPQPIAELHTNSRAGQSVLVVQARGNSYSN